MSPPADPLTLFESWFADARAGEPELPEAVALATANAAGRPSVRMVLLKAWGPEGFVFYTNLESRKGVELQENPFAALCFHWKSLKRQIRIEGPVTRVSDAEADAYFASRPRDSRIGAWASKQSRPMDGPLRLEREAAKYAAKFGIGEVPRPPYWTGLRVKPDVIEFWREKPFRLHERLVYRRSDDGWIQEYLFP